MPRQLCLLFETQVAYRRSILCIYQFYLCSTDVEETATMEFAVGVLKINDWNCYFNKYSNKKSITKIFANGKVNRLLVEKLIYKYAVQITHSHEMEVWCTAY